MARCTWLVVLLAAASAAEVPSAWDLVHPGPFDAADREQRRQLATDLLRRVELLADVVPSQSPREAARLQAEADALERLGDAATAQRRARLFLSRAYQQRQALDLLEGTVQALRCARDAESVSREMVCWARTSAHLLQEDRLSLALGVLRDRRLVPRERDMPVPARNPSIWYGEYGRGILNLVLIPYLEARAGEATQP